MNELKVGFLTLLAIGSLIVVSLTITANKSGFGTYIGYKTILNDATGIYKDSSIKVAGIVAGRITDIQLSGSQALVKFEVLEEIKISKFSKLQIKSVGFLGDKYLDIFLGDPEGVRLPEQALVEAEGGEGFEQLGKDAGSILKDVKDISKSVREALYDDEEKNIIREVMLNVRQFTADTTKVANSLKNIIVDNQGKFQGTINNLNKLAAQLARETDRDSDGSMMNDLSRLNPILANVDQAVIDLKDIIHDVKAGNGTVGKLLRDEEVIDKVTETLAGVSQIVNRVNNFRTDISIYSGSALDQGSRTELNVDLIPAPERFFRFGLIQTDFGRQVEEDERVTTSVDGAGDVVTSTKTVSESEFKFNLQIGRVIGNWGVRLGLIDSQGGFGVDYNFWDTGLSGFVEAYDFDEDLGGAYRVALEYRLWNVFYAKVTGEDLLSNEDGQQYTINAGLRFTDEDLAAILGLAL